MQTDQQDRFLSDIAREEANRPDMDTIPLSYWEKGDVLDVLSVHDHEAEVSCYWDGYDLSGIGVYSTGRLQEVKDIEITGRV